MAARANHATTAAPFGGAMALVATAPAADPPAVTSAAVLALIGRASRAGSRTTRAHGGPSSGPQQSA
jgi:hypothetical protein